MSILSKSFPKRAAVVAEYIPPGMDKVTRMTVVVTELGKPKSRKILSHQEWWVSHFDEGLSGVYDEVDSYLGSIQGPDLVVMHVAVPVPLQRGPGGKGWISSTMYHGDYLKYLARASEGET